MPVQRAPATRIISGALAGVLKGAHEAHKNDDLTDQGARLPAGIENGVAQLKTCKFGIYEKGDDKGKPFFMAVGIVLEPKAHNGSPVAGLRTQIGPMPICDTPKRKNAEGNPKTAADWYGDVMKALRRLGAAVEDVTPDRIEGTVVALQQAKPFFRFRTWAGGKQEVQNRGGKLYVVVNGDVKGGPFANETALKVKFPYAGREPMVNHTWGELVEYQSDEDAGTGTTYDEHPDGKSTAAPEVSENGDGGEGEALDLEALATQADEQLASLDENDKEAVDAFNALVSQIREAGVAAGIEEEALDGFDSWTEAVEAIRAAEAGSGGEEEGDPSVEAWEPQKGVVCHWQPINPATGKPQVNPKTKKPVFIEVEPVSIDGKKKTAVIRRMDTKKLVKDVELSDLSE